MTGGGAVRAADGQVRTEDLYAELDLAPGRRAADRPTDRPTDRRRSQAPTQRRSPHATGGLALVAREPATSVPRLRERFAGRGRIAKGPVAASFVVALALALAALHFLDPPAVYSLGVVEPDPTSAPTAPSRAPALGTPTDVSPSESAAATPSGSAGAPVAATTGAGTTGRESASGTSGTSASSSSAASSSSGSASASASSSSSVSPPGGQGSVAVVDGADYYVSPSGSDGANGSASAPFKTLEHAMERLRPGDTLVVGDGTYRGDVTGWKAAKGSSAAPITVTAAPGADPVVVGRLWFKDADYWRISGVDVRWDDSEGSGDHMVKFAGGTGFSFTGAEVSGARAYAGILLADGASGFRLANLYVHDTVPTHGTNQDHLIYVNTDADGGVIERCVLADSPNGRGVKVGPPSGSDAVLGNLTIRYNTMYDNGGPSNVQLSGNTRNVKVYRNILVKPSDGSENVTAMKLSGSGNVVSDNVWYDSDGLIESGFSGLRDGGGNLKADPRFADPAGGDFHTRNADVADYGRYAG